MVSSIIKARVGLCRFVTIIIATTGTDMADQQMPSFRIESVSYIQLSTSWPLSNRKTFLCCTTDCRHLII